MRAQGVSERRACRLVELWRSVQRAVSARQDDTALKIRMCELAAERRRFGYRRIHWMLSREGIFVNHKKVYRLYREQGLAVRKRRRRHKTSTERVPLATPSGPNHTWSMDFVFYATAASQVIKYLTVVDDCTKECVDIAVASGLNGQAVVKPWITLVDSEVLRQLSVPTKDLNSLAARSISGRMITVWHCN